MEVWDDTLKLLASGKTTVVKTLMSILKVMSKKHYVLNKCLLEELTQWFRVFLANDEEV